MTQQKESVVTPERFASGMTYPEWIGYIKLNKEKFDNNYKDTVVSEKDVEALRGLLAQPNGPVKVLALGEDWCPDVVRGLPVMARIAEATGMELRIFARDQNLDIMNEFLKDGEYQAIPTFVFYTRAHKYICHWIERPVLANEERHLYTKLFEGRSREEAMPDYEAFQKGPVWAGWRQATVQEIRQLLQDHCS